MTNEGAYSENWKTVSHADVVFNRILDGKTDIARDPYNGKICNLAGLASYSSPVLIVDAKQEKTDGDFAEGLGF
jgi:hypothetical protein